jgi:hypothetical protein
MAAGGYWETEGSHSAKTVRSSGVTSAERRVSTLTLARSAPASQAGASRRSIAEGSSTC